jgi:very-short-patch-repair endonuclease
LESIADFYCYKVKLIIEIDGLIHKKPELKEHDKKREQDLKALGYCMLRFTNKEILTDIENALKKIRTEVENLVQNFIINQK